MASLAALQNHSAHAQDEGEDDVPLLDPEDLAEFLALGRADAGDLPDLNLDDDPDIEDPRIDDPPDLEDPDGAYKLFLPMVQNSSGAGPAVITAGSVEAARLAAPKPSHRERALREAIKRLGYTEINEGGYRNLNKFSGYFEYFEDNKNGIIRNARRKWCADFVSWAFDLTGYRDGKVPWVYPASVSAIKSWAERSGLVVSNPKRGDIFVMKGLWKGRWQSHCGIIRKVYGGKFLTVEGNAVRRLTAPKPGGPPRYATIWVAHDLRNIRERTDNGGFLYRFVRMP